MCPQDTLIAHRIVEQNYFERSIKVGSGILNDPFQEMRGCLLVIVAHLSTLMGWERGEEFQSPGIL
jgi:hypothetical protein